MPESQTPPPASTFCYHCDRPLQPGQHKFCSLACELDRLGVPYSRTPITRQIHQ